MQKSLFSSESVTEGHPDKICDQISDRILDECLKHDPQSRVAVETCTKTGMILMMGEITAKSNIDFNKIARETLRDIGYTREEFGMIWDKTATLVHIQEQSPDISEGIQGDELGAGDQGMMFGYACQETNELMPLPIDLAHKLAMKLTNVRKNKILEYLGPDGKTQVTVEYEGDQPKRLDNVVLSAQHLEEIDLKDLRKDISEKVIKPVCDNWLDNETKIHINPAGKFSKGGPYADSGLTGRKIIMDTYGGYCRHGGGAFSGKDPTKVDRTGAYLARYIAKNIVASKIAKKCEVQVSYAIGIAKPVSVYVNTFDTSEIEDNKITDMVKEIFPLKPGDAIAHLKLDSPKYQKTSNYGHFGRKDPDFTWENTDKVQDIQNYFKISD